MQCCNPLLKIYDMFQVVINETFWATSLICERCCRVIMRPLNHSPKDIFCWGSPYKTITIQPNSQTFNKQCDKIKEIF